MTTGQLMEFGVKRDNEERRDGGCAVVYDPVSQKFAVGLQEDGRYRMFSGGVDKGEDITEGILREVREESGLYDFAHTEKLAECLTHYHNVLKNVNRVAHATCLLVVLASRDLQDTHLEEHEKFSLTWATAEELIANWEAGNQNEDFSHWIYFTNQAVGRLKELGY